MNAPPPGCEVEICAALVNFHMLTDCNYTKFPCKFEVDCTMKLSRQNLQEHEMNYKIHLELIMKVHASLQKKLNDLQQHSISFELPTVSKYQTLKAEVPFKVSPNTYAMKLKVKCTRRFIVLHTYLIPGENDDNLQWPFSGNIKKSF